MKNPRLILTFVTFNVMIIFVCIYQYSCLNRETYAHQRLEQTKEQLTQLKTKRQQELCLIKNPAAIKKFAQKKLGMKPLSIKQIHALDNNETVSPSA